MLKRFLDVGKPASSLSKNDIVAAVDIGTS
jgi:hypothetical protein